MGEEELQTLYQSPPSPTRCSRKNLAKLIVDTTVQAKAVMFPTYASFSCEWLLLLLSKNRGRRR